MRIHSCSDNLCTFVILYGFSYKKVYWKNERCSGAHNKALKPNIISKTWKIFIIMIYHIIYEWSIKEIPYIDIFNFSLHFFFTASTLHFLLFLHIMHILYKYIFILWHGEIKNLNYTELPYSTWHISILYTHEYISAPILFVDIRSYTIATILKDSQ